LKWLKRLPQRERQRIAQRMLEGPASHYFAAANLKIRSLLVALNANRVRKEINNV
jgi:hypothetical protein